MTSWSKCSAAKASAIDLNAPAPVVVMMVGLQGSGKTTTSAKIAKRLAERRSKKVLMASLDTRRPAAQEQLRQLGEQADVDDAADHRRPVAGRYRQRAPCRRPSSAAMTSSSSTPPAAPISTSR